VRLVSHHTITPMMPMTVRMPPKIPSVAVPPTDPAFGSAGGVVPGVEALGVGVEVLSQIQLAFPVQVALRHSPAEQLSPDAQSLVVTHELLHPVGGVGDGVGHKQLD
jgi:hypothetical protein